MNYLRNLLVGAALPAIVLALQLPAHADEPGFTVSGFELQGENPLTAGEAERVLAPYVRRHAGVDGLRAAANALEARLQAKGFGFYRVVLPAQEIGNVIQLRLHRLTLNRISVKGSQFHSDDNIVSSLPQLVPGTSPNTRLLARDLALTNENPDKRVAVTFKQGALADTIDAEVEVKDTRTVSGFVALDNTGSNATGQARVTFGLSHSNLFDRDQQAVVTYTTSPTDPGKVHQWGGFFKAPLVLTGGMVSAYYSRSSVASGIVANAIQVTGRGAFAGLQYTQHFARQGDYRGFVSVGLDDRHFRNDGVVTLAGAALFPNYRTRPLTIGHRGQFEPAWGQWSYDIEHAHNLVFGGGNDSASYGANRVGASTDWNSWRLGTNLVYQLPANQLLLARARAQYSNDPLVPGEQFGLGGAQSVRGLRERVLAGDSGLQASLEYWTAPLLANTRFLMFYDFGEIRRNNDALLPSATVASVGLGVRWVLNSGLSASLDLGQVVRGRSSLPAGTSSGRAHLNVNYRY